MNKKKKIATKLWLALFLVLATFSVSHADYIINNLPERIQEHSNWCWDASSQAVLNYYEHFPSQCEIADWAFSRSDCCGNSTFYWTHPCNNGKNIYQIGAVLAHWGVNGVSTGALSVTTVRDEANAHRPFVMGWYWDGGGGHAVDGRGYVYSGGTAYVYFMDPWPGNGYGYGTYDYVLNARYQGAWGATWRVTTPGEAVLYNPWGDINNSTPTYQWFQVSGATWYRLYVRNAAGATVYDNWLDSSDYSCSGGYCSYSPSMTLSSGTHTWWIQTFSSNGYGPWSNSMTFTNGCPMPGKVTLTSPSGAITTSTPTYRWDEDGPATWYQLYVYNDTDGRVVKTQWVTESSVCSGGVCSYNPGVAVDANDNHRWWIQTYNSCGYGPWSDPLSFRFGGKPGIATLISPSGTISTLRPTYTWTAVPTATWYELYVYDYTRSTMKIDQWYRASDAGCSSGTGNCSITPTTTLNTGSHSFWIKAYNGLYGDWSNPLAFVVSTTSCGFNEQFNSGNAELWTRFSGTWNVVSSLWYYTYGLSDKWAFSAINRSYSNADYRAKLWRVGTSTFSNTLVVRASGSILSDGFPSNCYMFQYGSSGQYSVWKHVNGTSTAVKYWTSSSYINKGSAWNELRAYVSGTFLWFSINGNYVWSGYDSSLSSGAFGLGMSRSTGGSLYVDWATLTCLSGAAGGEALGNFEISPEQQRLNEAADAQEQTMDATGAQY